MSKLIAIIVAVSCLLPPGFCLCAAQGASSLRQLPVTKQVPAKGCKKCGHCRQAEPVENPVKEHTPSCPAVKKLDSIRGLDAPAAFDVSQQISTYVLIAEAPTGSFATAIDAPPGSDPPKRLLFCTLLI